MVSDTSLLNQSVCSDFRAASEWVRSEFGPKSSLQRGVRICCWHSSAPKWVKERELWGFSVFVSAGGGGGCWWLSPLLSLLPTSICCSPGSPLHSHWRCSDAPLQSFAVGLMGLICSQRALTHGRVMELDSGEVKSRERGEKAKKVVKN